MLLTLTLVIALLAIVVSVHGGFLSSHDKTHRRLFMAYGVVGLLLIGFQGLLIRSEQTESRSDQAKLRDQITTLVNATRLQATLDDIKGMQTAMGDWFLRLETALYAAHKQEPPTRPEPKPKPEPRSEPPSKAEPEPAPREPLGPPTVEHVRITQRRAPSNKADAPYGLQVILQTDTTIQPAAFKIDCDGQISEGRFFVAGQAAMMSVAHGLSEDKKTFQFSFRFPPFTPESPIVVTLLSKTDIRVTKVERIPPMF